VSINRDRAVDESMHVAEHANVNKISIDLGAPTMVLIAGLFVVIFACGIVMGVDIVRSEQMKAAFENDQRQWRYAELKYDELNLVMRRAGLSVPGDLSQGVGGNLDPRSFKPKEH
jgi:hypothetical protein